MGPMTGKAAGYCAGYTAPGYVNPVAGAGYGFGFGRGMGLGFWRGRWCVPNTGYSFGYAAPVASPYAARPAREQEVDALQEQAKYFEDALANINKRLGELEVEKSRK
jgi:hypothetical protein